MTAPRWRKVTADLAARPGRTTLAIAAMAVGVFALATLSFQQSILRPVIATMYGRTNPASATLYVDAVDDALVEAVKAVPGVGDAEARPVIMARVRVGSGEAAEWIPAVLYVVRDFDRQRLDLFRPNDGAWPPADGEVLLERSAVRVAKAARGDALALRIPGGDDRTLTFAGTVHAAGLAPAWMEHVVYGFVPWTSAAREGEHRESAQLKFVVAEHVLDEGHIHEVAGRVEALVESRGHTVTRLEIPTPGRHPHAAQMDTFMYLLGTFALLAFLLSAVQVASMVATLQAEQIRQVGIMKAIGATSRQIAGVYLAQVGLLAAAALAVALPFAWIAGRGYARFSAGILNADVTHSPFPWWTLAGVVVAGVVVPLLAALAPLARAARISVHQALADDPAPRPFGAAAIERLLARVGGLPRPLILSLRATFMRRGRLALTIGMLAIGGAMFMAALNVSAGWNRAVVEDFARRRYDLTVMLAQRQPVATLDRVFAATPQVAHAEYWAGASPYLVSASGAAGPPITLVGIDPASRLLDLKLTAGRWLDASRPDGAVVNNAAVSLNPTLRIGGTVALRYEGRTITFPIVGIAKELTPQAIVYAPKAAVRAANGTTGDSARTVRIVTRAHDAAGQLAAAEALERAFRATGIEVGGIQRMEDAKKGILDHLVIIVTILTLAAGMVVFVGGIGLSSALTIQVVQRTREIGIQGALGARPRTIAGQVWFEGVTIAVMSWAVAAVLAAPASFALESVTGRMFFRAPLDFTLSAGAAGVWLALVVVLATLASVYPAWRASRLTVREALAHV